MIREKTFRQISEHRAKELNNIPFFKESKIRAVKPSRNNRGTTFCELYCMSTRKRVKINTSVLYEMEDFNNNPNSFLSSLDRIQAILRKDN